MIKVLKFAIAGVVLAVLQLGLSSALAAGPNMPGGPLPPPPPVPPGGI